jgi:hypothetical protein
LVAALVLLAILAAVPGRGRGIRLGLATLLLVLIAGLLVIDRPVTTRAPASSVLVGRHPIFLKAPAYQIEGLVKSPGYVEESSWSLTRRATLATVCMLIVAAVALKAVTRYYSLRRRG